MALPQPPKVSSSRIDDWMFQLWREQGSSSPGQSRAFPGQNRNSTNGSTSIAANYNAYVPSQFEISSGDTVFLESGSILEIG